MKIGYFLGAASLEGGGLAPYAWRLLDFLLKNSNSGEIEIVILCSEELHKKCIDLIERHKANAKLSLIPKQFDLYTRSINKFGKLLSAILLELNLVDKELYYLDAWFRWFNSLDIDLLHVPYQVLPCYNLPYPAVITMHDVQELHFPEFFTPEERLWRANHYWKSLKDSSGVVVSFAHVKQDLIEYFHLPNFKIHVCPLPFQEIQLKPPSKQEKITYQEKYTQLKEFILYPAQTWQHKNHLSLIKAVEFLKEKKGRVIDVVCTGKKNPVFFPVIKDYLNTSTVADQINFLDIVPETELHWLYKNCALVVIPTLYEAGSFPLLEAMGLEAPVICSSVTSLPETISDNRFVFEPLNIEQMANLIIKLLDEHHIRTDNIENGKKRFKELKTINSFLAVNKMWGELLNKSSNKIPSFVQK